ncbi:MAG: AAA family ATPase, partial [Pseudomonadota bacterium]
MDLFEQALSQGPNDVPLAERLRPKSVDDLYLSSSEKKNVGLVLKRIDKTERLPNLLLWGPPGSGKTTLARLLVQRVHAPFLEVNAVDTGAKRLKEIAEESKAAGAYGRKRTVLFVDEIHRLNRAQQDVLLPYTETGVLSLIGATTENPAHAINAALLSRCTVLPLSRKGITELSQALEKALQQEDLLPAVSLLSDEQRRELFRWAAGDFRTFWNLCDQIEGFYSAEEIQERGQVPLEELIIKPARAVGKQTSKFYDLLSAMIKSIRGTDPDAAVYYMTCLLEGGEDPKVIGRRLIISASEDIGNANPMALEVATAGYKAIEVVGLP